MDILFADRKWHRIGTASALDRRQIGTGLARFFAGLTLDWHRTYNGLVADWQRIDIGLKMDWRLMVDGLVGFVLRRDTSVACPYSKLVPRPLTQVASDR